MTQDELNNRERVREREGEGTGVPIGEAMLGTTAEVRDTLGRPVAEGFGEIFLGEK